MAAWWPQGWDSVWHYCATMAPVNEALDKPFLRIRLSWSSRSRLVSGLVIWPQGFHAKGHGSVPCGPSLLGLFSAPHPCVCVCVCVCVCANGTMGLPQLLSPCSASVLFIPMGDLLQASTVSFFLLLLIKKVSVQNTFPTPSDLQVSHFLDISDLLGRVSKLKSYFPLVLTMSYQVPLCVWKPLPLYMLGVHCPTI